MRPYAAAGRPPVLAPLLTVTSRCIAQIGLAASLWKMTRKKSGQAAKVAVPEFDALADKVLACIEDERTTA